LLIVNGGGGVHKLGGYEVGLDVSILKWLNAFYLTFKFIFQIHGKE
jgi:hypothetical protein